MVEIILFEGVLESEYKETYFLINKLGTGATSQVFKGVNNKNKIVSVKVYQNENSIDHFSREVESLDEIKHKNIIKMLDHGKGILKTNSSQNSQQINYIILEYACYGDLFELIRSARKGFGEELGAIIFKSVLDGLEACYDSGYYHGDLKTENILIDGNFEIKISDFGFSNKYEHDTMVYSQIGTDGYYAPEVYNCHTNGFDPLMNDIFAVGVMLFIIVAGKIPFCDPKISDKNYKFIIKQNLKGFWKKQSRSVKLSDSFKDLFSKLVDFKAENRITIRSIKKHPWLVSRLIGGSREKELFEDIKNRQKINLYKIK